MLPIRLEMQNFLAYRTPDPLQFKGIHLACLSGANGAGKSSILDAITWALWGKSRARSDDDLIHIGQNEVSVTLDFIQGDTTYRVIRKRKLGKQRKNGSRAQGTSTLDLFGFVPEENTFRLISEPSIRQTQARITGIVGLDYDIFIKSAYLQQGNADAFTVARPAERKDHLFKILNLDLWNTFEERAKDELKLVSAQLDTTLSRMTEIEKELAAEEVVQAEFERALEELEHARTAAQEAEERYLEIAGAEQELTQTTSAIKQTKREIERDEQEIAEVSKSISGYQQEIEQFEMIIAEKEAIESGYSQLVEAREANEALGDALRELNQLNEHIRDLEKQIAIARQEVERELTTTETQIHEALRKTEQSEELRAEAESLQRQIFVLEQDEARRESHREEIEAFEREKASLEGEQKSLEAQMEDLRNRIRILRQSTEDATCPACGQPLTEDHRHEMIDAYMAEGVSMKERKEEHEAQIKELNDEIRERKQGIRILDKNLKGLNPLRSKLGSVEQRLSDIDAAERRSTELQSDLDYLKKTLSEQDFAHELQRQLSEALEQRESLNYNTNDHDEIRERLSQYEAYQSRSMDLQRALQSIEQAQHNLEKAEERHARFQGYIIENKQKLTDLEKQLQTVQAQVEEMERRKKTWQEARTAERNYHEKMISLKQQLTAIEQSRERYQALEVRVADLREQQGVYDELKGAFGKNGIPAMVIEAAVPELEETANELLRRMTNGRLAVRFETQREKKSGGVAETFDIWIADEIGTRDYEMYSGGEAFRINFAIRVAISQMLARRAGAQLRTLFIDEGFGTQDEEGRARLIEAITAIQDDFDLILVITHIDELRDAFPVRIEVEKLESGSRIRVI